MEIYDIYGETTGPNAQQKKNDTSLLKEVLAVLLGDVGEKAAAVFTTILTLVTHYYA